jgi:esterase/lipase superfamily enzyme
MSVRAVFLAVFILFVAGCDARPRPHTAEAGPSRNAGSKPDEAKRVAVPPRLPVGPEEPLAEEPAFPEFAATTKSMKSVSPTGVTFVPIFYATDRRRLADQPNEFYGSERADDFGGEVLQFGRCIVTIPPRHHTGEIEQPSLWRLEISENPNQHVVLLDVQPVPANEWLASLQQNVASSASKSALVFVHGFSVTFAAAARRTAQMKFDLDFDGAAVVYTWPAPKNYPECENNVDWTRPHLIRFLTEYMQQSGARRIHLVAHSMGTRILTTALAELASASTDQSPRYNQIILAAPDIDAAVFKRQIAPRIADRAERISVYSSSKDIALVASKKVHKYVRLGEGGANITVLPEFPRFEVLDASAINESLLGHSYYGDSPTILGDIRQVLAGISAASRGLQRRGNYYALVR